MPLINKFQLLVILTLDQGISYCLPHKSPLYLIYWVIFPVFKVKGFFFFLHFQTLDFSVSEYGSGTGFFNLGTIDILGKMLSVGGAIPGPIGWLPTLVFS